MVSDHHGTRLEQSKSTFIGVIGTVFFLSLASQTVLFSVGTYQETTSAEDTSVVSGCWSHQAEIILGANPSYCLGETYGEVIDSLEVSEDQHIRENTRDSYTGELYTAEYRWEDLDDSVVYGFIEEGRYRCERFIPEFALENDWVVEDIDRSFEYPDWCGGSVENQDTRVYEEGAHPYDDVWMYWASDVGAMLTFLYEHKTAEDRYSERQYVAKSYVEQERAEWEGYGDVQFGLSALFCTVPITLLFLFAADQRPRVFVIDRQANTIKRKRRGRYPSFSRTWNNVNFPATAVVRSVRQRHHSTSATEDSPAEHWTTDHPGLNIVIEYGRHQHVLLFFEDGGDVNVHGQAISDFMAALGLGFSLEGIHDPQAEMFARPTLRYLAESNGAGEWNDETANFILSWYYESDPHFLEKYPQFETDPEFMLEPHGKRPFKEMYRRPLYEGAGLTSVRSTEDAQRLLDHLIALRQPPSNSGPVTEMTTPSDGSGAPSWSTSIETPSELNQNDSEGTGEKAMGSFWSFDDANKP